MTRLSTSLSNNVNNEWYVRLYHNFIHYWNYSGHIPYSFRFIHMAHNVTRGYNFLLCYSYASQGDREIALNNQPQKEKYREGSRRFRRRVFLEKLQEIKKSREILLYSVKKKHRSREITHNMKLLLSLSIFKFFTIINTSSELTYLKKIRRRRKIIYLEKNNTLYCIIYNI